MATTSQTMLGNIVSQINASRMGVKSSELSPASKAGKSRTVTYRFVASASPVEHIVQWKKNRKFKDLKDHVASLFGYSDVAVSSAETRHVISSDAELATLLAEWNDLEGVRKQDVLTAWIVGIQAKLSGEGTEEAGLHALWELGN